MFGLRDETGQALYSSSQLESLTFLIGDFHPKTRVQDKPREICPLPGTRSVLSHGRIAAEYWSRLLPYPLYKGVRKWRRR